MIADDEFDLDLAGVEADVQETLCRSREGFCGRCSDELNALAGLSWAEVDAITLEARDLEREGRIIEGVTAAYPGKTQDRPS